MAQIGPSSTTWAATEAVAVAGCAPSALSAEDAAAVLDTHLSRLGV